MNVKTSFDNNILTVYLDGELDASNSEKVKNRLEREFGFIDKGAVILDMSNLYFIDSTGLGMLIGRYKVLLNKGIPLKAKNMNEQVRKIFKISGLNTIIKEVR